MSAIPPLKATNPSLQSLPLIPTHSIIQKRERREEEGKREEKKGKGGGAPHAGAPPEDAVGELPHHHRALISLELKEKATPKLRLLPRAPMEAPRRSASSSKTKLSYCICRSLRAW